MDAELASELLTVEGDTRRLLRQRILAYMRRHPSEPQTVHEVMNGVLDISSTDSFHDAAAFRSYIRSDYREILTAFVADGTLDRQKIPIENNPIDPRLHTSAFVYYFS